MHIVDTLSVNTIVIFPERLNESVLFCRYYSILFSRPKTEQSKTPHKDRQK